MHNTKQRWGNGNEKAAARQLPSLKLNQGKRMNIFAIAPTPVEQRSQIHHSSTVDVCVHGNHHSKESHYCSMVAVQLVVVAAAVVYDDYIAIPMVDSYPRTSYDFLRELRIAHVVLVAVVAAVV
uniref:Uncharacterized protein n=1 Tax=Megaselia scalaris TaxID=36166 RepID=T1GUK1_MEGSC